MEKNKLNCRKLWATIIVVAMWHNCKQTQWSLIDCICKTKKNR